MTRVIQVTHDCKPPQAELMTDDPFIKLKYRWKCNICKQKWRIEVFSDGTRLNTRIGIMRYLYYNSWWWTSA